MPKTKKVTKSLSSKINKLMYKRGDICCTEDIDRETAITFLLKVFKLRSCRKMHGLQEQVAELVKL